MNLLTIFPSRLHFGCDLIRLDSGHILLVLFVGHLSISFWISFFVNHLDVLLVLFEEEFFSFD